MVAMCVWCTTLTANNFQNCKINIYMWIYEIRVHVQGSLRMLTYHAAISSTTPMLYMQCYKEKAVTTLGTFLEVLKTLLSACAKQRKWQEVARDEQIVSR